MHDRFSAPLATIDGYSAVDLHAAFGDDLFRLPWSLRVVLENVLRCSAPAETPRAVDAIRTWLATGTSAAEIPFHPRRLLMHDTTCVPALVDIAAMRDALAAAGVPPERLNPVLPVDVSVDHSIAVDVFNSDDAVLTNMRTEFGRNHERFSLMKWAQNTLKGMRVHPPGTGILHTINLEQLATLVSTERRGGRDILCPDTVIGTDSHTPMVNGIGVLGWGCGGLEAESLMFGFPLMMRIPDVIGVRLTGRLPETSVSTDFALAVTERLRKYGINSQFIEFFGPGMPSLTAGDRAVVANMAPEYGATTSYFPIDERSLDYLRATGRPERDIARAETYARQSSLFFDPSVVPRYTDVIEMGLGSVRTSISGPRRPQDRLDPKQAAEAVARNASPAIRDSKQDGLIALAAITSCTNTTDPRLLVAAGLLARKASAAGLKPPSWVKTSFSPGSPAAQLYLARVGLLDDFQSIGFGIVGFGCMTCIGNSGPLAPAMQEKIAATGIRPVAVLSGNRNFPGRVHPQIEDGFLCSPPLVAAYALAGTINGDITTDVLGHDLSGNEIRLKDIWPSSAEVDAVLSQASDRSDFGDAFALAQRNEEWRTLPAPETLRFPWDGSSTYLRPPPFASALQTSRLGRYIAHPLLVIGDDVTTDQISPAGQIAKTSVAAAYLVERGDDPDDLNVFASRRGNYEAMVRGLYTNNAVDNFPGKGVPPGSTVHAGSGETMALYDAAARYEAEGVSTVIVAGERYGAGSSRDWAAKGPALLGVRAVLALSFERIHRQNLIGMGILPIIVPSEFRDLMLGLGPTDTVEIDLTDDAAGPNAAIDLRIGSTSIAAGAAVETLLETDILRNGGIISLIVKRTIEKEADPTQDRDRLAS
jgi:aconitate hydratase